MSEAVATVVGRPPRLLVFDSGVGGLSVAACIHRALPTARFVYLADNAGFPYGNQPESVVLDSCCGLIARALAETPCDAVVVACNTASTLVLPRLRSEVGVPVVGVVPAIKPAAAVSENRRLGVLATPATIRRPYLQDLIRQFAGDCELTLVGEARLVRWAEDKARGQAVPADDLGRALAPLARAGVDTVVLGCTHYPLLKAELAAALPSVRHWVESGDAIARRVVQLLGPGRPSAGDADPDEPVSRLLLSGPLPDGLLSFMAGLGLAVTECRAEWGGLPAPVTTAGSV
ncbi:glutamate racemase [Marinobacter sp. C2H3]|uniref:glutamate racemase n=1 Tax=Marinobacter sp. C2H3 TaxID=3119003 RepID=UPI00300F0E9A